MIGRLITTLAGGAIAKQVGGVAAGPAGLIAGAVLPGVLRRLGPAGMIAAAVGGYVVSKVIEKRNAAVPKP
ncbi:MAG: hypothetical protein ACRCUI_00790 [Polymorphobacter sp.]